MKRFIALSILWVAALTVLCSCSETKKTSEYSNWEERNSDYIESIAQQCAQFRSQGVTVDNAQENQMFRLLSYKLDPSQEWENSSYVYCQVIKNGNGTDTPFFTDSVYVNYRLRLIPTDNYPEGQVMDQSYKTAKLDPDINIPAAFQVSSCVKGVSTALMYMNCGDIWRIYIPQGLGYGSSPKTGSSIPEYSTLIFDLNLVEIARTGQELSPR